MQNIKKKKKLLDTNIALRATTAFAAEKHQPAPVPVEEKVVVSSQEQPASQEQSATESQETSDATAAVASEAASAPVASN